jgi:hypothetical protein
MPLQFIIAGKEVEPTWWLYNTVLVSLLALAFCGVVSLQAALVNHHRLARLRAAQKIRTAKSSAQRRRRRENSRLRRAALAANPLTG